MPEPDIVEMAVDALIEDLISWKRLGKTWELLDDDIKKTVRSNWLDIVQSVSDQKERELKK